MSALEASTPRPNDVIDPVELDEDGLLRFEGRWVAITDAQLPVVRLLVAAAGHLVRTEDILDAYCDGGGSPSDSSLRSLIHRLNQRLRTVGLRLHVVRNRGVVLGRAGTS